MSVVLPRRSAPGRDLARASGRLRRAWIARGGAVHHEIHAERFLTKVFQTGPRRRPARALLGSGGFYLGWTAPSGAAFHSPENQVDAGRSRSSVASSDRSGPEPARGAEVRDVRPRGVRGGRGPARVHGRLVPANRAAGPSPGSAPTVRTVPGWNRAGSPDAYADRVLGAEARSTSVSVTPAAFRVAGGAAPRRSRAGSSQLTGTVTTPPSARVRR